MLLFSTVLLLQLPLAKPLLPHRKSISPQQDVHMHIPAQKTDQCPVGIPQLGCLRASKVGTKMLCGNNVPNTSDLWVSLH